MPTRIVPPRLDGLERGAVREAAASPASASRLPIVPAPSPNIVARCEELLRSSSPPTQLVDEVVLERSRLVCGGTSRRSCLSPDPFLPS